MASRQKKAHETTIAGFEVVRAFELAGHVYEVGFKMPPDLLSTRLIGNLFVLGYLALAVKEGPKHGAD